MANSTVVALFQNPWRTILSAGLLAGALDIIDAIVYFGLRSGVSAKMIFMYIASGLVGRHTVANHPSESVLLGLFLHFFIACTAATAFYFAARAAPSIIARPFTFGTLLGLIWYGFMYRVVIPLSAIPRNPDMRFSFPDFMNEIFAHVFLVGIPIALMTRRSMRVPVLEAPKVV